MLIVSPAAFIASATVPSLKVRVFLVLPSITSTLNARSTEILTLFSLFSVQTSLSFSPSTTPVFSRMDSASELIVLIVTVFSPSVTVTVLEVIATAAAAVRQTVPMRAIEMAFLRLELFLLSMIIISL